MRSHAFAGASGLELSAAARRMLEAVGRPCANPRGLLRRIESDASGVEELFRVAILPLWGFSELPSDLGNALERLGSRRIPSLVALSVVGPILRAPVPAYGLAQGELWEHSIATAVATREILLALGLRPCEEAFTAGLLHDVGKLVIGSALASKRADLARRARLEGISLEEAECRMLRCRHADAGADLLASWGMPQWLVEAVRSHHAPPGASSQIAELVHLADALCLSSGVGVGRDGLHYTISRDVSSRWNLSGKTVERVLSRTLETLEDAKEFAHVH